MSSQHRTSWVIAGASCTLVALTAVAPASKLDEQRPRSLPSLRMTPEYHTPLTSVAPVAKVQLGSASNAQADRQFLDRYCIGCHNQKTRSANLTLDTLDVANVAEQAAVWEKVALKLRSKAMPPPGRPQPAPSVRTSFITSLETALDHAAATHPNPGRPAVHRLNRAEYANAVRDLLALEIDGRSLLPSDDSGYGFDNIADVLTMSPGLLERYLAAARHISRLAVGDPTIPTGAVVYKTLKNLKQEDRLGEEFSFGLRGGIAVTHQFPVDGTYSVRMRLGRTVNGNDVIHGILVPNDIQMRVDGVLVKQLMVGGPEERAAAMKRDGGAAPFDKTADANLVVEFPMTAGPHLVVVGFVQKPTWEKENLGPRFPTTNYAYQTDVNTPAEIEQIAIGGPYAGRTRGDSPSRRRIFTCRPESKGDEVACAKEILSTIARRAYRRPVAEAEVQKLLDFYRDGANEADFDSGIQFALERILVDPSFLFRVELDPPKVRAGTPYRLNAFELASRLSFFLWSSIPDDELLDLAAQGKLADKAELSGQVRRMLADQRSSALVSNFGGQWLLLRNLKESTPDTHQYPDFDENLREAFQKETELFLESQIRENRSVPELLKADYTFVNERLAAHYNIPNIYGTHYRRVTLPEDKRLGLLGHGSILTVTLYANRTSPVLRGKWLLDSILGAPPPSPPPDVPPFEEGGAKTSSVRERLEQHRKNPACSVCHAQIDPLGFALENYDAVGDWRETDGGSAVDASGALVDGTAFNGPRGLRDVLLQQEREVVANITQKLLTYALGRGVEYYDKPVIRAIVRESANDKYSWSSLILGIVNSSPFQMRSSS